MFSCETSEIFKNAFSYRTPPVAASVFFFFFKKVKVLEYLRTCNIFDLKNGPRVTFGIFDGHMLKKGILSYQTT